MSYPERDSMYFVVAQMDAEIIKELRAELVTAEVSRTRVLAAFDKAALERDALDKKLRDAREEISTLKTDLHGIARAVYPHKEPHFTYNVPFMVEEISILRDKATTLRDQLATVDKRAKDFEDELERHATDRVNQRKEIATLTERAEKAEARANGLYDETMKAHVWVEKMFGEETKGRDFDVKFQIAERGLADSSAQIATLTQERDEWKAKQEESHAFYLDQVKQTAQLREKCDTLAAQAVQLREALVDLVDASQDARCADLRVVIQRAGKALSADAGSALAELRELREDKERLDAMILNGWRIVNLPLHGPESWHVWRTATHDFESRLIARGATWRAAIDAARRGNA